LVNLLAIFFRATALAHGLSPWRRNTKKSTDEIEPGARHKEAQNMKHLRRLYARCGVNNETSAILADTLLLAAVAVAALAVFASI
jgi:hypothetical protein